MGLLCLVPTPATADWDASVTVECINLKEDTAKASRRKCEFDQMREILFVREADDLALATSHLAQSSSASRVKPSAPPIIEDDFRLSTLSRAWCGLFESRSGKLKIKQKLCRIDEGLFRRKPGIDLIYERTTVCECRPASTSLGTIGFPSKFLHGPHSAIQGNGSFFGQPILPGSFAVR